MSYVLKIIFVIDAIFLVLVVLLQSGKGGDVAAAFGGAGSQTAFGPRGAQKPLEKATIAAAAIFMGLALMFSLPGVVGPSSVVTDRPAATLPSPSPEAAGGALATPTPESSPAAEPTATPQ
ncbi:MAG: preprotein translocase subunit SecG [Blastocatellales bacterium]|nr:preprotein translocase subunit SecG [Blastocatellales bacterium]